MGKRDRWDSSDEESEKNENKEKHPTSSTRTARTTASSARQSAETTTKKSGRRDNASGDPVDGSAAAAGASVSSSLSSRRRHNPLLHGCRSVYDTYDRISRVSEGTYGVVWKAKEVATQNIVALKQVKFDSDMTREGFPVAALREISVLLALSHESIVSVKEMVVGDANDQVFMVMEFFEFDLKEGIELFDGPLFQGELKGIMQQILSATEYMHRKFYLHRDLKTSNILVHRSGRVALADFGLARRYQDPPQALTQLVVTLWYRAPELLFGETHYSTSVDLWSLGCIFGELICKDAILQGQGELDQIDKIFSLVGLPDDSNWPSFQSLPNAGLFRWKAKKATELLLPKMFPIAAPVSGKKAFLDSHGYDLLCKLLTLDPGQRISASEALHHRYFHLGVEPKTPRFFSSS